MKLAILIPAYNEEKTLARVIETLPKKFPGVTYQETIVVNDGSIDATREIATKHKVTVISHWLNRGLGGALGTGFQYTRLNKFDCLITFDADGQHHPDDIAPVIRPIIQKKADVSIGSRFLTPKGNMPWYRRIGIFGLNLITYALFWVWTTDSQSGLRAFSRKAVDAIRLKTDKMEVSSEFFNEIQAKNLKMVEVPIRSIYTKYSLSKGQKNSNGIKILFRLISHRLFGR
jgi:glycosyltransferase involved in cell wall biosynthesis